MADPVNIPEPAAWAMWGRSEQVCARRRKSGFKAEGETGIGKSAPQPETESTVPLRGDGYQAEALPRKTAKLNHAAASTANRHRWSGKRIPRRMGDPRLRN